MSLILNPGPKTQIRRALAAVRGTPLRRAIAVGCALALVLASCASEESTDTAPAAGAPAPAPAESTAPPPAEPATPPSPTEAPAAATESDSDQPPAQIIGTTTIWADIARNVACGGLAEVEYIIPPVADPHDFEASMADRARLDAADLIVENGLLLEQGLRDTLAAAVADGTPIFSAAAQVTTIEFDADMFGGHGHDEHEDHDDHEDEHEDHDDHEDEHEDHDDHEDEHEDHDDHDHEDEHEDHDDHDHEDEHEDHDDHEDEHEDHDDHDHEDHETTRTTTTTTTRTSTRTTTTTTTRTSTRTTTTTTTRTSTRTTTTTTTRTSTRTDDHDHEDEHEDHDDHDHEDEHEDHDDHEDEDGHHDHDHGSEDPHVWLDPVRVARVVESLATVLVDQHGLDAGRVSACVDAYLAELGQLHEDITDTLATVPAANRKLVTNHDAFGYFADRYDFEVIGTVIPSLSTLAEPSPASLEALAELIEETGISAIFSEYLSHSRDVAAALADRLDGVSVVSLYSGALGEEGSGADTYLTMMRANARTIAEALSG